MSEPIETQPFDTLRPTKAAEAMRIVHEYMGWSTGAGLIPVPLLDLAGISLVELKMVHSLTNLYGVPFSRSAAKSIIGALIGGGGTFIVAMPVASVVKFVPVIGQIIGVLTEPAIAAAATYALGKVFIQHFESGGTLLDFNIRTQRHQYEEHFAAAQAQGNGGANGELH
ncbi:MAG: YcjF family protein [Stellaceae bacterium]